MEDEIDLRDIINVLWKSRLLIIGIFMISVLVAGTISFAIPPVYKVSAIIELGNFGDPTYTGQAPAKSIMLSDSFLLEVFEQLYPKMPIDKDKFGAFKDSIKIGNVGGTDNLLQISVETPNTQEGVALVNEIAGHYVNLSEDSYNERKKILSHQLVITQGMLVVLEKDINQTRGALMNIGNSQDGELRSSNILGYLQNEESRHSSLLDRESDLQKQLTLFKHCEIIQAVKEPVSPIWPKKTLIIAIAGMLSLMIGVFAAFIRVGLRRPAE